MHDVTPGGEMTTRPIYLSTKQVAAMLDVDESTVRRWKDQGLLPYFRFGPKCIRYRREDIEAFGRQYREGGNVIRFDKG